MMFAAAALAVCTGTAYGQVLDVAPVGDAVMPDGRRVYAMPQTTVVVDITVARESVVTGPYARFAQKYFGVIAPLADKETYTLRSAVVSRYDPVVTRDLNPGPIPAPHTEIYADTGSAEEFPRVLPDRRSASGSSLENAARDAAQTIFDLRSRRTELITGDYAETVYGAGLATAPTANTAANMVATPFVPRAGLPFLAAGFTASEGFSAATSPSWHTV